MLFFSILIATISSQVIKIIGKTPYEVKKIEHNENFQIYELNFEDIQDYYKAEISIHEPNMDAAFMMKRGSPPTISQSTRKPDSDNFDWNGYILGKQYHYLIIDRDDIVQSKNNKIFIGIFSYKKFSFKLTIIGSVNRPCPICNSKNSNGCDNGRCMCKEGFIDEDCSVQGEVVKLESYELQSFPTYLIFETRDSVPKAQFTFSTESSSLFIITALVPDTVHLPSKRLSEVIGNTTMGSPFRMIVESQNESIDDYDDDPSRSSKVIIQIEKSSSQDVADKVNIKIESLEPKETQMILIATIAPVSTVIILGIIICLIYKLRKRKTESHFERRGSVTSNLGEQEKFQFQNSVPLPQQPNVLEIPESDDGEGCPICLEGLSSGAAIISTPCNHIFHGNCIRQWILNKHEHCPNCRYPMKLEDLKKNSNQSRPNTRELRINRNPQRV